MVTSSSSEEKSPEIECQSDTIKPISKLTANYRIIPRNELEVHEQLGAGTYGSVFKGVWRMKTATKSLVVALKKVFMLEREVYILSQVRHRNIIQFFGVSQAKPDFYIVTEYAENRSLFEYLHNANAELSCERVLKWAKQIAHGVAYLHYEAPTTIIHRDLKSNNVVLGKKLVCKICDFGTSKDLTHSYTAPTWGGTAAWMSPEIINQHEGITTATDIWSYGVLLWELLSQKIPYKGLTEFKIYSITSQEGSKLVVPDSCPKRLSELLERCWYKEPKKRICMRQVVSSLLAINEDKQVQRECVQFVQQKETWHKIIKEQFEKLNALELDYERRKEELKCWEQLLRRRESSHRNFLHIIDVLNTTNVMDWDPDCVCEWVQYMASGKDINEIIIDKIIGSVLQHEICGSRLLNVTEGDLENLGIEPVHVRQYIVEKIGELKALSLTKASSPLATIHQGSPEKILTSPSFTMSAIQDDFLNFPSLQMSAEMEAMSKQNKNKSAFDNSIILIVGLYCRKITTENVQKCRFKVFLDTDWNESIMMDDILSQISDSATVVKDVFISMTSSADNAILLETVRCVCPPFGYLDWIEIDENEIDSVNVSLTVTYTDQIIQPRSTRMTFTIDNFAESLRNLHTKNVPLKIRPIPTNTSISRINSSMYNMHNHGVVDKPIPNPLQGVWKNRRTSLDVNIPESGSVVSLNGIIPVWSDIAGLQQHYEQRFARNSKPTVNRCKTVSGDENLNVSEKYFVKNIARPLVQAKSTNLEDLARNGVLANKALGSFSSSNRSSSALPTTKLSTKRPALTVVLKKNPLKMAQKQKEKIAQKFPKQCEQQKEMQQQQNFSRHRFRTQSETESQKNETPKLFNKNESNVPRPTFYVCEDLETPSTSSTIEDDQSFFNKTFKEKLSLNETKPRQKMNSNNYTNSSLSDNNYLHVNNANKNNEINSNIKKRLFDNTQDKNLSNCNETTKCNQLETLNQKNSNGKPIGEICPCRLSRRNWLLSHASEEENDLNGAKLDANLEESISDRKYKLRQSHKQGKTKTKTTTKKKNFETIRINGKIIDDFDVETLNDNVKCRNIEKGALSQQNTISQHVYGGYNKWRWK